MAPRELVFSILDKGNRRGYNDKWQAIVCLQRLADNLFIPISQDGEAILLAAAKRLQDRSTVAEWEEGRQNKK